MNKETKSNENHKYDDSTNAATAATAARVALRELNEQLQIMHGLGIDYAVRGGAGVTHFEEIKIWVFSPLGK